jgi:hypothetical protein
MKTKQNLEILKDISSIEMEVNKRCITTAYELFVQNREWASKEELNEKLKDLVSSIENISTDASKVKELIAEYTKNIKE